MPVVLALVSESQEYLGRTPLPTPEPGGWLVGASGIRCQPQEIHLGGRATLQAKGGTDALGASAGSCFLRKLLIAEAPFFSGQLQTIL